jgi:hypothetical protein
MAEKTSVIQSIERRPIIDDSGRVTAYPAYPAVTG